MHRLQNSFRISISVEVIEKPSRVVGHRAVTVRMKNDLEDVIFLRFSMVEDERELVRVFSCWCLTEDGSH